MSCYAEANPPTDAQRRILERLIENHAAPATRADVRELRDEIAALRALLTPPSAVILTGAAVVEHYAQLAGETGGKR